ncbi:unnamed protein product, partial [Cylicocyclus nassatus]
GTVCIDYVNTTKTRSIVIILDNSGSPTEEGWKTQMKFMKKIFDSMKNIRVGVVVIEGHSRVQFPMSWYNETKSEIEHFVKTAEWEDKWTSIGVAIYKARIMLEVERTDEKIVVLISDGDSDQCLYDYTDTRKRPNGKMKTYVANCENWKREAIKAHPQVREAEELRKRSIRLIYVIANEKYYDEKRERRERVLKMVASPDDIIRARHFTSLMEQNIFENLMKIIAVEQI